ncbi:hypothetical protein OGAPHI_005354 [Ogataea philodendri]|uniref:DASH complex subunit DAD3 n=1 Tax=Ogataea philodendri TaxID=1378263 RepID=A0A9P8T2P1_9ASCO|nr:uncharacterized protein OGAPHI_005354 [Ogataea philodendri]KAH3663364.1 hypothetical protein OGAPHI_005354 [Ogataea philodendri]
MSDHPVAQELVSMDYDTYASELSPLEIETLKQYQNLALNLIQLKNDIVTLNKEVDSTSNGLARGASPKDSLLEELRELETKVSVISTLFKSSVYQVVVNNSSNLGPTNELTTSIQDDTI